MTTIDRTFIREMVKNGKSVEYVSSIVSCGVEEILRVVEDSIKSPTKIPNSIKSRDPLMGRPKVEIDQVELQKLIQDGLTKVEIAKHFGCGEATIYRRLKEL